MKFHSLTPALDALAPATNNNINNNTIMAPTIPVTECYPVELHFIKALFLEGQYRRCIQACRDIINMAGQDGLDGQLLRSTFINFYLGLAHDCMARKMHPNSVARVPALASAEQAFAEAIDALPSFEATRTWCQQQQQQQQQQNERMQRDFVQGAEDTRSSLFYSPGRFPLESNRSDSPLPPSPTYYRSKSPTSVASQQTHAIDFDEDLESEDGFSQLMTPNRILQQGFSRMSLLQGSPPASHLPREASRMSLMDSPPRQNFHPGLLRQVHPGSSRARPSQTYSTLPAYNLSITIPPKPSQLAKRATTEPRLAPSRLSWALTPELVSPISPSDYYARRWSNASTISAISPETPVRHDSAFEAPPSPVDLVDEERVLDVFAQIHALKDQLEHHVASVQDVKKLTKAKSMCLAPITGTSLGRIKPDPDRFSSPIQGPDKMIQPASSGLIQQARSYWSFVPDNIKETEKKNRIAQGRERMWTRKRFDPAPYRDLCEQALAEL